MAAMLSYWLGGRSFTSDGRCQLLPGRLGRIASSRCDENCALRKPARDKAWSLGFYACALALGIASFLFSASVPRTCCTC